MTTLFTMTDFVATTTAGPRRIDYDRMKREWPKQKRQLAAAVRTKDVNRIAAVCVEAVEVWDEIGAWPDDWALFQRALDDALPWNQQVALVDLAYNTLEQAR